MDVADFERLAVETYRAHGLDPNEPANPVELARRILRVADPVEAAPWLTSGSGALLRRGGQHRIALRPNLPIHSALFALCHELAHVIFEQIGFKGPRLENACDYLGACLMSPAPATQRLVRTFGADAVSLAESVAGSHTWAAMRMSEALEVPLVFYDASRNKPRWRAGGEQLELFRDTDRLRDAILRNRLIPGTKKVIIRDAALRVAFLKTG